MNADTIAWQSWATLALGALAIIALLYVLKPRRRRVQVPFGGLWQRVVMRSEARVLGQRWRRLLSWLLMSAIAALLLGALGEGLLGLRGCSEARRHAPYHTVVIVDTSASMQTLDGQAAALDSNLGVGANHTASTAGPRSRLAEAVERAVRIIDAARPRERFLLLAADARPRVLRGWSDDRQALTSSLKKLRAHDAGLDLSRALAIAQDALFGRENGQIVLVTDGGPPTDAPLGASGDGPARLAAARVERVRVGPLPAADEHHTIANLAVERVSIRPTPADKRVGVLLARVRNDADVAVDATVTVASSSDARSRADFARQGALRAMRKITLPPRAAQTVTFKDLELDAARFAVTIAPAAAGKWRDIASYDDIGFAVLTDRRELNVRLVGAKNLFLQAALMADDRYWVERVAPDAYQPAALAAKLRAQHGVDVVVLDQVDRPLPDGMPGLRLLLKGADDAAIRQGPELVARAPDHPVMQGISFHDVNVDSARVLKTLTGDKVLATNARGEALMVARDEGVRRLELGLDLLETDLVGRYALPVLMGNAIDWLVGEDAPLVAPLVVGRVWGIEVPVSGRSWQWLAPDRPAQPARVAGRMITASSVQHGVHEWRADDIAVVRGTRLPQTEKPGLTDAVTSAYEQPASTEQARNQAPQRQMWRLLLLLAAALIGGEWWLYMRRRTV